MTSPTPTLTVAEAETRTEKLTRVLRAKRRRAEGRGDGTWLGLGEIRQMVRSNNDSRDDKDAVRGELISLVASGFVEVVVWANGTFWRARMPEFDPKPFVPEPIDGHYILQWELMDDRGHWFDAETFTNAARAERALGYAEREALSRSMRDYPNPCRVQRVRLLTLGTREAGK